VPSFADAGADVVVASRKLQSCEVVAAEVESRFGRQALAVACNVSDWHDVERLADASFQRFGKVDVLVNNAGMSPLYDRVVDVSEALFDKVIGVNLKGPFRLTALVGTRMAAGDGGSIINISSIGAEKPTADIVPYSAAKAGLNATTVAFAMAFGPKVRVNCIMPGSFMTDVTRAWDLDAFAKASRLFALRRGGEPDEIVGTALYFASDASSYTTGAILRVDGGVPR
jgi:NAD(P)-dependent dehydrogenase (short-subunit alcohol dehydrogenase family)